MTETELRRNLRAGVLRLLEIAPNPNATQLQRWNRDVRALKEQVGYVDGFWLNDRVMDAMQVLNMGHDGAELFHRSCALGLIVFEDEPSAEPEGMYARYELEFVRKVGAPENMDAALAVLAMGHGDGPSTWGRSRIDPSQGWFAVCGGRYATDQERDRGLAHMDMHLAQLGLRMIRSVERSWKLEAPPVAWKPG
jgi:hypothetical protein